MQERRVKGTGSIVLAKPGESTRNQVWRLRWEVPAQRGKRKWESATVRGSRAEAERTMRQKQQQLEKGYVARDKQTVGEYLAWWLDNYGENKIRARTLRGYRQYIRSYTFPIADIELQKLRPGHVQGLYKKMQEDGLSGTTITQMHRILHRAFVIAIGLEKLNNNPAAKERVFTPAKVPTEMNVWDEATLQRFFDLAQDHRFRDVFLLAVLTGLRRGELCGLKWDAVDFDQGTISVAWSLDREPGGKITLTEPKNKWSRRLITMGEDIAALLHSVHQKQLEMREQIGDDWNGEGWVFCSLEGGPTIPDSVTQGFAALLKRHGIPKIRLHDLRHEFASLLLKRGVDLKVTSELMGHANVGITADIYSHLLPGMQREAISRLDGIVKVSL